MGSFLGKRSVLLDTQVAEFAAMEKLRAEQILKSDEDYMRDFYQERPFTMEDVDWYKKFDDEKMRHLDEELERMRNVEPVDNAHSQSTSV